MTYSQTLDYLFSSLPMYQRIGAAAYKPNLGNIQTLCTLLGNPENKFQSVHVGGTNGKGSVSHTLASVLQCCGYKVGLYTSPHLLDFRERIKINGKNISEKKVIDFVEKNKLNFELIKPSFFEMTVALAFQYFAEQKVDIAIIEVGLGGRLDSTNVITPLLSVITNISKDHTQLLGNTLQKIAFEKAGIIKPGRIAVIGEHQKATDKIFISSAKTNEALLCFAEDIFSAEKVDSHSLKGKQVFSCDIKGIVTKQITYKKLVYDLPGLYQRKNVITSLVALALLEKLCGFTISEKNIRKGFGQIIANTGLLGRWQILSQKPLTIADVGHNEAGIKEVIIQLKKTAHKKLHVVFGTVNDKKVNPILKLLPKNAFYYFCKASIPRSLDENILCTSAKKCGLKGSAFPSVTAALKAAKERAGKEDLILIGGSTFVVADALTQKIK